MSPASTTVPSPPLRIESCVLRLRSRGERREPAAYLQRHAVEIGLKDVLATAHAIRRERDWLAVLQVDPKADAAPAKSVPFGHDFKKLRKALRQALQAIGSDLPEAIADLTKQLGAAEMFDPTRFRYLTRSDGAKSFPESEVLPVVATQEMLEAVFETHLVFQGFDRRNSEWNLVTELAAEGENVFQGIREIVPLDRL